MYWRLADFVNVAMADGPEYLDAVLQKIFLAHLKQVYHFRTIATYMRSKTFKPHSTDHVNLTN